MSALDPQMQEAIRQAAEAVAAQVAKATAREVLISLGLNPDKPLESQRDMAALREISSFVTDDEFQRDMVHLRRWRKSMETIQSQSIKTVVKLVVTGIFAAIVVAFSITSGK